MAFRKTVLITASVILLISLIIIGIILYNSKYNAKFPPVDAYCPDYWNLMTNDGETRCNNNYGLGTCTEGDDMQFNPITKFPQGLCQMYNWAKGCDITWQGVTNASEPCGEGS
tara:strand:- start:337 stop:675 length:339 start_codon:yes stop_codon:yes gene_type:complete